MKLSVKSWHYRLYDATYQTIVPTNLCPYFWKVLWALLIFPFNIIWNIPARLLRPFSHSYDDQTRGPYVESFAIASITNALLFLLSGMIIGFWHIKAPYHDVWFALWCVGWSIVSIFIGGYILYIIGRCIRNRRGEDQPNILVEFIRAKYHKYCPSIEWDETEDHDKERD